MKIALIVDPAIHETLEKSKDAAKEKKEKKEEEEEEEAHPLQVLEDALEKYGNRVTFLNPDDQLLSKTVETLSSQQTQNYFHQPWFSSKEVAWSINVDGLVIIGPDANGFIPAGTEETVKIPFTIALGKVDITVTAGSQQETYSAFALGPFFLNMQEI